MKFDKNLILRRTAYLLGAAALAAGTISLPVNADYAPVSGVKDVTLEKYLVMKKDANVPNVSFNYTIAAGAYQASNGTDTSEVFAGNDPSRVTGTPTIAGVTFKPTDTTYNEPQTLPTTVNTKKQSDGKTDDKDAVTLGDGEKYARQDIKVDFSGVRFKEPGIYRYIVTETAGDTSKGIVFDTDATRVMDVYVNDNNGQLEIGGYVLHNQDDHSTVDRAGKVANATKADGFVNKYTTWDLTISKNVDGNQASRDEYFPITVKISNAIKGTKYDVDLTSATATLPIGAYVGVANEGEGDAATIKNNRTLKEIVNPATLTVGDDGTVTQVFYVQHNQSIKIKGLANNTSYSVKENATEINNEGYEPSAEVTGDTKTGADPGTDIAMDKTTYEVVDTAITADTTVAYKNTKTGTIPTGILSKTQTAGFVSLAAVAGIGLYVMLEKHKKEEEA